LIRRISSDDPGWGEERIVLELNAKLGVVGGEYHIPAAWRARGGFQRVVGEI
jgi:hypothetical protein